MTHNNITPDLIRSALTHIPANYDRDAWARVGMAIKSEFPDDVGCDLFTDWSATADSYNAADTLSTWRSIKAGGGVGIGTLLHLAKEHGFVLPKGGTAVVASPTTKADNDARRKALVEQEQAAKEAAQKQAATEAQALWDAACDVVDPSAAPYLARKGVQAYSVRFSEGWLLVPLRDCDGALWNVQRIAPAKPTSGPDKLFLKGGRKSGLWHWCGDPAGAAVLLVAEGYATASTLHEATGLPVAVAFDAGNMVHVAKALRQLYPAALLVLCGDDDAGTQRANGSNPGRDKATAAAKAVHGLAVFPEGLPEGGSDFNDLHQHVGGTAGLAAVGNIVQAAISVHHAAAATASAARASGNTLTYDRFTVRDDGVWHRAIDGEGNEKPPMWVCSRLDVEARTRDQDGAGWGYLLSFTDPAGLPKQWAMPARMLSSDGGEYRAMLLNMGLLIASSPAARNLLTQYIQTRQPQEFATCTDRVGWHHGRAFVLPKETVGDAGERIVFQSDSAMENTFRAKGTPELWRERVSAKCAGNSRLVFALACAFGAPLMRPAGMESGGFHIRGDSSSGKTTALKVAASVYGGESYLQRWRTTDNALEAIAAQHCDCLLILDELAQVDPKTAGECAYMLANEQSKARATRNGAPRSRLSWRLLFLSAGELGLADHMAEGQKRARTGQEVRMADIPADAGKGLGAFECIHGHAGGAEFSKYLTGQAATVYGAAGRAWLQWLADHAELLKAHIKAGVARVVASYVPHGASGQVDRVAARFALVGVAGEMATEAGLTGWKEGESEAAAKACFDAWLYARGGAGNGEVYAMLRAVRRFLEAHGEGRFTWWHRGADDRNAKTLHRAGFRRMLGSDGLPIKSNSDHQREYGDYMPSELGADVSVEYFILPEVFRSEVCQGFDYLAVCRVLLEHGCITPEYKAAPDGDKAKRFDTNHRLPGVGLSRCYRITPAIFTLDL